MRRANRNRILRSIITRGPASRAELSRRTGMSRPTVSVIANELLTSGVLMEGERVSSGGAPGTLLEIAKDTGVTLVVDLQDIDSVTLATVSPGSEIVKRRQTPVRDAAELVETVVDFASGIERKALIGAAIAVDGFITAEGQWQYDKKGDLDVAVIDVLRRRLRMDVWPVHAIDAITVADLRDSEEDLAAQVTVVVPSVCAGLIIDGNLLSGTRRPAGDIAHVVVGLDGPVCATCGRHCLHATIDELLACDTPATRESAGRAMAAILAPLIAVAEVEEVVLALLPDGSASSVCDATRASLTELLPDYQMPTVRLSTMGTDAVLLGAALMFLHRRLI